MKRVILLLACIVLIFCSVDKTAGISTVETENAFVIKVWDQDSAPAVNVVAKIRPLWYVQDIDMANTESGVIAEYVSDSLGLIRVDSLKVNRVSIEIQNGNRGIFRTLSTENMKKQDSIHLLMEKMGSLTGQVHLSTDHSFAWIQVFGTDRLVKTDSLGNFRVDSLPPSEYLVRAITAMDDDSGTNITLGEGVIRIESDEEQDFGILPVPIADQEDFSLWPYSREFPLDSIISDWMLPLSPSTIGFIRLNASNFDFSEAMTGGQDLRFADQDGHRLSSQIAYWDDSLKQAVLRIRLNDVSALQTITMFWGKSASIDINDSLIWDGLSDSLVQELYMLDLVDFESENYASNLKRPAMESEWYFMILDSTVITDPYVENALDGIEEAGEGREGYAFHWKSSAENGRWSFWGIRLCQKARNLKNIDSVVYYVRGLGRYSFAFEALDEFNGKALFFDTLQTDSEWVRRSIKPTDFAIADSNGANIGWDLVGQKVTSVTFSAYGEAEIWLDDIRIYGINRDDIK